MTATLRRAPGQVAEPKRDRRRRPSGPRSARSSTSPGSRSGGKRPVTTGKQTAKKPKAKTSRAKTSRGKTSRGKTRKAITRTRRTRATANSGEPTAPRRRLRPLSRLRPRIPMPAVVCGAIFMLLATALSFEAVQIGSQAELDQVRGRTERAADVQRDLRAQLSAAESPAETLEGAADLGLIEPAGVVALASPPMISEAERG